MLTETRPEFRPWPKAPRLANLKMLITEKIDGTNACVVVTEGGAVYAQSRNRFIVPEDDNYGFAAWVATNEDSLRCLGPGYHYGEWYGRGIQRGYGLDERRFALFNVGRWILNEELRPSITSVVPLIYQGEFDSDVIRQVQQDLVEYGSSAVPGFMNPEGVMVYIPKMGQYIKHPIDPTPKGVKA